MIQSFVRSLLRRARFESDMDEEMRDHIAAYRDDLVAKGVAPDEALRRARVEFGPIEALKEECRERKGLAWPDTIGRDLRFALRILRKSPAFSLTAIATLALCIGANTAIFSVVDAIVFRPLPYPEPDRLAVVATSQHSARGDYEQLSQDGRAWRYLTEHARSVDLAVSSGGSNGVNLEQPGASAAYVKQQRVSAGFFRVLGVTPAMGREIATEEDRPGGPAAVAVVSYELWTRLSGSAAATPLRAGRKIELKGEPYEVIGVMGKGFQTVPPADVWTPLMPSTKGEGSGTNYMMLARMHPGFTPAQADAELGTLGQQLYSTMKLPAGATYRLHLTSVQRGLSEGILSPLLLLWAAVILVLVIGCVNIAGLMLARGTARAHEMATRMALGSGKSAVVRQLLVESLVIAICGCAAGLGLGYLALSALRNTLLEPLNFTQPLMIDWRVLLAMAVTAFTTSLIFGLYPAIETTRVDLRESLVSSGRTVSASRRGHWARSSLVVSEVALGLVLLVSAGLILRTLWFLTSLEPGYDGHNVLTASLSLQDARYKTAESIDRLFRTSLENLRAQPGVVSAGIGLTLPYERALNLGMRILDGTHKMDKTQITNLTYVTAGYLEALRIPIRQGRPLADSDTASSLPVVVVNEAFVRRYLRGGEGPVGRHLDLGDGDKAREIVAVVGDVQERAAWGNFGPVAPLPEIYIPASQLDSATFQLIHTWFSPKWVVRSASAAAETANAMQRAVHSVDPHLPFAGFKSMDEIRSQTFALQRLESALLGMLAVLALVLVAVGVFGLIAHSVAERNREFGIRLALGSTPWGAVQLAIRPGIGLTAAGIGAGFLLAQIANKWIQSLIWGVRPGDPITLAAVAGVLLITALVASLLPSFRIARMNPVATLREQ